MYSLPHFAKGFTLAKRQYTGAGNVGGWGEIRLVNTFFHYWLKLWVLLLNNIGYIITWILQQIFVFANIVVKHAAG